MKGFIPLFPTLLKENNPSLQVATLKSIGVFTSLSAIIPVRMQNYFREVMEMNVIKDICDVIKSTSNNNVTALHMVAAEVISTFICPVYGDFYSFPWKRGPHDNLQEF